MASRTLLLPRKLNEILETPPETLAWGRLALIQRVARMKSTRVVVVLFHAGGDGEDVGVEDDVFRRKADFVDEDVVGALADADLLFVGRGLALLVKGHDDDRGAILEHGGGVLAEFCFAFLERDGVDDALALKALEAGFDDLPLGGVDHEGDFGDFGLAAEQLQEAGHGGDAVDHAFVHADVDDVGAVLYLLAGDGDGFFEFAFLDELGEFGRAGDVGALADHDEDAGLLGEGLRSGEAERLGSCSCRRSRCDLARIAGAGAGAGLRAPWRWRRCARACCRSSRRRC